MGLFSDQYTVVVNGPGRVVYREGNREYLFPFYEEDGDLIVSGEPTKQRVHLFFGWYWLTARVSEMEVERILPRVIGHFRNTGRRVRAFDRGNADGQGFVFHPELFEARARASDAIEVAGFSMFSDYSSIDLLHEEYGLEICGIRKEKDVETITKALQLTFPHWHFTGVCFKCGRRDPGAKLRIHMFRRRSSGGRFEDTE